MGGHPIVRRLGGIFCAAALVVAAAASGARAQTTLQDPDAYRVAKQRATATFLDRGRPQAERLEAARHLGYPDAQTFVALIGVAKNRSESDVIRLEALKRHRYDEQYLETALAILSTAQDGGEELDAGLVEDLGRRTTFRLPAQIRQRVQGVLRSLLDDKRDRVRLQAYRVLVAGDDEVAINRLADSLRKGSGVPVPLPEAIDLLDQAGSVNHIDTLRPFLKSQDPRVQAQAARALAVDPASRPAIAALAKDPKTPDEVRANALRALAREDDQFGEYAIEILQEGSTSPRVRQAAMQAFVGRMNYKPVPDTTQIRFAEAVEKLAADTTLLSAEGGRLKNSAQELHDYLRKTFPVIQKHYEKR